MKGRYRGAVEISEIEPPDGYRVTVSGGGQPGGGKAQGKLRLVSQDGATEVTYDGSADLFGPAAAVGQHGCVVQVVDPLTFQEDPTAAGGNQVQNCPGGRALAAAAFAHQAEGFAPPHGEAHSVDRPHGAMAATVWPTGSRDAVRSRKSV